MKKCKGCNQPVEMESLSRGLSCAMGLTILAMVAFGVVFIWVIVNTLRGI